MNTPQLIIQSLSGIAAVCALYGGCIMLAEARAKAASRRWWRDRDPMWVEPLSVGANTQGCSDSIPGRSHNNPPNLASHPAQNPHGAPTNPSAAPTEFISNLIAGGSLRRVA